MGTEDSRILFKMLYVLKKLTDDWLFSKLCHADCQDFNNSHLPLLFSIEDTGISNSKLAVKLNISKQAASKVIKELEENDMVMIEKCPTDARSANIFLTEEGKKFKAHIKSQVMEMEAEYVKLLGSKNYNSVIDSMQKMIDFHEHQLKVQLN